MECITNHRGFRQYVNDDGANICPDCGKYYTNEGDGVICDQCDRSGPPPKQAQLSELAQWPFAATSSKPAEPPQDPITGFDRDRRIEYWY